MRWRRKRRGLLFFFQAEDGIRDGRVTGVQTCALPISLDHTTASVAAAAGRRRGVVEGLSSDELPDARPRGAARSEERRVGKSVDLGGRRIIKKKKNGDRRGRVAASRADRRRQQNRGNR